MPLGLYQQLESEQRELQDEERAIIAEAEHRATSSGGTKGFTDDETERLSAIDRRLSRIGTDMSRLDQARERDRLGPAVAVDEPPVDESAAPKLFRSFGEQLISIGMAARSGIPSDPRLGQLQQWGAAQGLNERVPSEGGFLVEPDFSAQLLRETYDSGILASRCRRTPISGSGYKGRAVDESSRADGSRLGGLQAYWTGEAEAMTATKPKFREIRMDLEKLTGVYYATDELLADASALQAEVQAWFVEEFGFKLDDAIVRGSGAGMPLGILGAPALVSVAKEAAQAAATVLSTNLYKMFARQPARSLPNSVWVINQEVWPQLFALEDTAGRTIFLPGQNLASAPFGTILGRPIVVAEHASALGTQGDISLDDFSRYLLIEKGGVEAASSIHVQFLTGETAFRFVIRANGQPIPHAPVTPYKGSATLSPFVTLDAR